MRILTFLHSFEPGGVERVALRLVRQWRQQGVDAPLFLGRTDGAMRDELATGLACHVPRQPPFSAADFETLWMIATLPAVIRRMRPDALFCAGNSYAVVAVAMKLLLGSACPPILAQISNDLERLDMCWPVRMLYRLWLRIQGRFIDHFVAIAPGLDQEIAQWVIPRAGSISVIPSPALSSTQIDRLRAAAAAEPPHPMDVGRRFVAIGRLARQKNFPLMLKAFAAGSCREDRLVIHGEGPERRALAMLASRLDIVDRVDFAGHVPEASAQLRSTDILLLSSDFEGMPAVVLEALAVGMPIIATDCSRAMRPLLRDGALGELVPPGNLHAMARAIADARALVQDPEASLDQARRFTLDHVAQAYVDRFAALSRRQAYPRATSLTMTSST
ncbi:glycosyltransferase [Sphingobium mellinum]|uniref:glycosyltransferase n=1 Tax=Sphingobium mellinum TaxID=1387166 RepID=UPI0030EEA7F0